MKLHLLILLAILTNARAATNADTIVLDETGVKNLRIETVEIDRGVIDIIRVEIPQA